MIERYASPKIEEIWCLENKLDLWQKTELAVIRAKFNLGEIKEAIYNEIYNGFKNQPIDVVWFKKRDEEIHHDLNAFLDERSRFLTTKLQQYFHKHMTSYDTEESPFAQMLKDSIYLVEAETDNLLSVLKQTAIKYRYTVMVGRTHGQEAELQSFGKRCLSWYVAIDNDLKNLKNASTGLKYSRLSGAIGNYTGISPELEKQALAILGFEPFYGSTQIMPREIHAPIAQALCQIVLTIDKISTDIRLGARSGNPICHEPFRKKQKGSSAMPHKKNTIRTERIEGMGRLAQGYLNAIMANIKTWEERAIEQSCVERVAWPDLFHVTLRVLAVITRVLEGLVVYPDNMLKEVHFLRGCYASANAKDFLAEILPKYDLGREDAYRMVQLAAFNVFEPENWARELRKKPPSSFEEVNNLLEKYPKLPKAEPVSIKDLISRGDLVISDSLDIDLDTLRKWNDILKKIFADPNNVRKWNNIFKPSYLLRNEKVLYKEILSIE